MTERTLLLHAAWAVVRRDAHSGRDGRSSRNAAALAQMLVAAYLGRAHA